MAKTGYVDGFVLLVPKKNTAAYQKMAKEGARFWLSHGALDYKECMIDDANPFAKGGPQGLPFGTMTRAKKSDVVWFSYITYKSRAHRDQVNKKVMAEMDKKYAGKKEMKMPFNMDTMAYGGFKVMVG